MKYATLVNQGSVSIVSLNRPDRLNAISPGLLADLHTALVQAQEDSVTDVIVLTGTGRAFCAGDDLKDFDEQTQSAASIEAMCESIQQITRDLMFGPKLVVGAIHGYAVGGGFEWVLNCDLVVASEDLVCFFPEMQLGHFVTGALTNLLPSAVGYQRALEMIVLGERQSAATLKSAGLVNRVVASAKLMDEALRLAVEISKRSKFATQRLKRAINSPESRQISSALDREKREAIACFSSEDTKRRIDEFVSAKF